MHRWVEQEAWGKVREKTNRVSCDESRPSEKSFQRPPQSPQHLSAQGLHSVQKKMQQMKHQATPDSPQAVRREEAGEGARPSLGHVTAGPLSAGVPKAHLRVGWGFWVQLPLCAAVFFKSHSLHFQIKGFFSFFFPIVLWWRSVWIRSFLSVKNLPNLERKQMWPSLVPLLVSRVSSHSILTFCFLHHLCSSQFYTVSWAQDQHALEQKESQAVSVSSAPRHQGSPLASQGPPGAVLQEDNVLQATWRWESLNTQRD